MSRRLLFEHFVIEVPRGFTPRSVDFCFTLMRKNPFASMLMVDCGYNANTRELPSIRLRDTPGYSPKPCRHVGDLFPGHEVREFLSEEEPLGPKPGHYALLIHLPSFHGFDLFIECGGVGENRFAPDLPVWRSTLSSLAPATDEDRRRIASPADYEIKLTHFPAWGKKCPEWSALDKKRLFPVIYPNGEATRRDRKIVEAFRAREAEVADAVAGNLFASFAARTNPFLPELDDLYEELGLRIRKARDIAGHMVLSELEVTADDVWPLRLHFAATWNVDGQRVLVGGLPSAPKSATIMVEMDPEG